MADNNYLDITFDLINKDGLKLIQETGNLLTQHNIYFSVYDIFEGFPESLDGLTRYNDFLNNLSLSEVSGVMLYYFGDMASDEILELTYKDGLKAHYTDLYNCEEILKELERYYK